jgi:DNA-binding FadR family transcriptional regulator
MMSLATEVQREVKSLRTPTSAQQWLFDKLNLAQPEPVPQEHLLDILESSSLAEDQLQVDQFQQMLRDAIEDALRPSVKGAKPRPTQKARMRIFFETLMAWDVIDQGKSDELADSLEDNANKMRELLQNAAGHPWTSQFADDFWDLDGAFHRDICSHSSHQHLSRFIDLIIADCRGIGAAANIETAYETLAEHNEIVQTLRSRQRQKLFEVMFKHAIKGLSRWMHKTDEEPVAEDERKFDKEEEIAPGVWVSKVAESLPQKGTRSAARQISDLAFEKDLKELLKSHQGKWVAYYFGNRVGIFDSVEDMQAGCAKFCEEHTDAPREDLVSHLISPTSSIRYTPRF